MHHISCQFVIRIEEEIMLKIRLVQLVILAVAIALGIPAVAQTKAKPVQHQNPNGAVVADENATEQRSGLKDSVDIIDGPRTEDVKKDSAVLVWKTNKEAATRVQYGTDNTKLAQHAFKPGGSREHRVDLKNLKPGTTYFYAIENRGGKQRYDGQFQTPAQ